MNNDNRRKLGLPFFLP